MRTAICLLLVSPLLFQSYAASADQSGKPATGPSTVNARNNDGIERFDFRVKNLEWREVFDLLAEKTKITVLPTCMPGGSLTHVGPKGAEYTMPEILAIINAGLRKGGFKLILTDRGYRVISLSRDAASAPGDDSSS